MGSMEMAASQSIQYCNLQLIADAGLPTHGLAQGQREDQDLPVSQTVKTLATGVNVSAHNTCIFGYHYASHDTIRCRISGYFPEQFLKPD